MIKGHLLLPYVLVIGLSAAAAEELMRDSAVEALLRTGIADFDVGIRSADPAARLAALNKFMPDEDLLKALFGDDSQFVSPLMVGRLRMMRAGSDQIKAEFEARFGAVKEVELINVRKSDPVGAYKEVLARLPKNIPVYRAVIKYEKVTSDSSCYVLVDGQAKFVQSLEELPRWLDRMKRKAK